MSNDLDITYEQFHELKKVFEDQGIVLDFDPIRTAFLNPLFFDIPDRGDLVGAQVLLAAGPVYTVGGSTPQMMPSLVCEVVAHCHDRVVITFPTNTNPIYVGWIDVSEIRVLDIAPVSYTIH